VRFTEALAQAVQEADLLLEIGPGQVLARLAQSNCRLPAISLDCSGPSLQGLLTGLGAAYALGAPIDPQRLFADRFVRAFDLKRRRRFFQSPCELIPRSEPALESVRAIQTPAPDLDHPPVLETKALEVIRQLVAHKAELPLSAVKDDHHLLRDLHLNSISIGQIVVEAARRLGLPPPLAPTEYAGATVAQAAEALESWRENQTPVVEAVPSGVDTWVRAFAVEPVEQALALAVEKAPIEKGSWQVFAPRGHRLAATLAERLCAWGGVGVLVWLPPQLDKDACDLLLSAAHAALEHDGTERYFVLVQHHGIAAAFARTLYLEAKALSVRVVDVPPIESACDWVLAEVQAAEDYGEAYYDTQGKRWTNALRLLAIEEATKTPLGREDVLLISGGGKGIAAECGLALARESGAKLVLLGRSELERDPILAENLARFAAAGISFRYYSVDVSDEAAVRRVIAKASSELGPVTAILHGAGVNYPKPLVKLDLKTLFRTLAPKQQGLQNLLAAIDTNRLHLLVTFSSIIGRFGLPGEADYALANAELTRLTEEFQAKHPACRCLALEWSIWSGVGMGERLGRVDALLHQGISPITVEEGILWLRRLLGASTPVRVLVSGRLGSKPPLPILPQVELPFYRFLENPRLFYPGIELVVEAEISPASDFYLNDHVLQGERLLPAVLGLEAMAQAACAVIGKTEAPALQEVQFLHPIVVSESGTTLRIAALVRTPDTVEVVLRSSQTGFQVEHFRAVCRFGLALAKESELACADSSKMRLDLEPERDLYRDLLFQRGRFKRLLGYFELSAFSCQAEIAEGELNSWFSQYLPQDLLLGDPGARDAALHAVQACIPHALVLPIGLDCWLPGDLHAPGPWIVRAQERWQQGEVFCYDLALYNKAGVLRERLEGLRLKRMSPVSWTSWPLSLLVPYLQRRVRDLTGAVVHLSLGQGTDEQALQRILGEDENLFHRPDGKPVSLSAKTVAITHSGRLTLVAASANSVACDLETIAKRPWSELLGERHALAELIAREAKEDFDTAATRVWTAQECLKKAGRAWDTPLSLKTVAAEHWIILTAGACSIASWWGNWEGFPPFALAILTTPS
jgi:enediyne polyketide synthase